MPWTKFQQNKILFSIRIACQGLGVEVTGDTIDGGWIIIVPKNSAISSPRAISEINSMKNTLIACEVTAVISWWLLQFRVLQWVGVGIDEWPKAVKSIVCHVYGFGLQNSSDVYLYRFFRCSLTGSPCTHFRFSIWSHIVQLCRKTFFVQGITAWNLIQARRRMVSSLKKKFLTVACYILIEEAIQPYTSKDGILHHFLICCWAGVVFNCTEQLRADSFFRWYLTGSPCQAVRWELFRVFLHYLKSSLLILLKCFKLQSALVVSCLFGFLLGYDDLLYNA